MPLDPKVPYSQLTYDIIGAAMQVHRELREGRREEVYQNALEIELANRNKQFIREHQVEVTYDGQPVGIYYLDFLVEGVAVVELKAFPHFLTQQEVAQCLRYMHVTTAPVGLLLNFGRQRLEYKRILPPKIWQTYNPTSDLWLRTEGYK